MRNEEEQLDINWQPIVTMAGHPHGLYLCLTKYGDGEHHIEERYFTYDENHRSTFESDGQAQGVIAFMIPRFFPCGERSFQDKIMKKIKVIQKEGKPQKKFKRLCDYIWMLTERSLRR